MIEDNQLIKVLNRDNGSVSYMIPDLGNLHRNFESGETKEIPMIELKKLSYIQGGKTIIEDCLMIENKEALKELFLDVEPEYFYTEEDIKNLLLTGTLDQLLDCLDFAPVGVIDLVKKMAVNLKISDLEKRKAILEKTGFNVTSAIYVNEESKEDNSNVTEEKVRRSAPVKQSSNNQRRVITQKVETTK